jgi:hypothetical protein
MYGMMIFHKADLIAPHAMDSSCVRVGAAAAAFCR